MILLMVDDEPIIIQTLARSISIESLNIEKYSLLIAQKMQKIFLNEPMIDLVMCDIEMPQTNGLALLSWIRANYPQTGCVFVTNYSVFQYAQEAIRLGCLDYILKPITPQQITASIEKCIDKLHHPDKDLYLNQYLQKESLWHDMLFSYISGHEYILPSQTMLDILYYPVLLLLTASNVIIFNKLQIYVITFKNKFTQKYKHLVHMLLSLTTSSKTFLSCFLARYNILRK